MNTRLTLITVFSFVPLTFATSVGLSSSDTCMVFKRFVSGLAKLANVTDEAMNDSLLFHFDSNLESVVENLKSRFSGNNMRESSREDLLDCEWMRLGSEDSLACFMLRWGILGINLNDIVSFTTSGSNSDSSKFLSGDIMGDLGLTTSNDAVSLVDSNGSPVDVPTESNYEELKFQQLCSETKSALSRTWSYASKFLKITDEIKSLYSPPQVDQYARRVVFHLFTFAWPDIAVSLGYMHSLTVDTEAVCDSGTYRSSDLVRITAMNSLANILADFMRMCHLVLAESVASLFPTMTWYLYNYDTGDAITAWAQSYGEGINPTNYRSADMQAQVDEIYDKFTSLMLLESPKMSDLSRLGLVNADKEFEVYWAPQFSRINNLVSTAQVFVNTINDARGYDGSWARNINLNSEETKYYKLKSVCAARVSTRDKDLIETTHDDAYNAYYAHEFDVSAPVFGCVSRGVATNCKVKQSNIAETALTNLPEFFDGCSATMNTYDFDNWETDFKQTSLLFQARRMLSNILFVNAKFAIFYRSSYCPLALFEDANVTTESDKVVADDLEWTGASGYLTKIQAIGGLVDLAFVTVGSLLDLEPLIQQWLDQLRVNFTPLIKAHNEYARFVSEYRIEILRQLHYDITDGTYLPPPVRRLSEIGTVCSPGESNAFVFSQGLRVLLASCLTLGGQPDNDSDVVGCVSRAIPSHLGVTTMTSGCFNCLLGGVQAVNRLNDSSVRDACIADPSSSACSVDFSAFTSCSGYNMTEPTIRPYCSVEENVEAITSSFYRRAVKKCVNTTESSVESCVADLAAGMSSSCLGCWNDLIRKVANLEQVDTCLANPASNECRALLKADVVSFAVCSGGIDPIYLDMERIRTAEDSKSSQTFVFGLISALTLLVVLI